jgi:uncharacterized protein YndB with AHSA1/START domain
MPTLDVKQIVVEVPINAPRSKVWDAMLSELPEWWPQDFLAFTPESEKMRFEPRVGGRLYEETKDGRQLLWATLTQILPQQLLEFTGHLTPSYGGPSITMIRMEISDAEDGSTLFRLTDTIFGNIGDELETNMTQGWNYLFGAMKAYIEAK